MPRKSRKSSQIAVGGMFSALCLITMLTSSFIPFASYAAPMLAGAMLIAVVDECGSKIALFVYITVSILSLFLVADYDTKGLFIGFTGYYPIIRPYLEKHLPKIIRQIVKFIIFNTAIIIVYYILTFVLGIPDLIDNMGELGKYTGILMLGMGNFLFLIYDFSFDKYLKFYRYRLKPIISNR